MASDSDSLDWSEALRAVKGDRSLLGVLVRTFIEEAPRLLKAIGEAIDRGDGTALRVAAHTLKGSLRYFGAGPAFDDAFHLEKLGQAQDLSEARPIFDRLSRQVEQLLPRLSRWPEETA
jgi:HPt (histidine-containing phosphotransfer) domain-containing protein